MSQSHSARPIYYFDDARQNQFETFNPESETFTLGPRIFARQNRVIVNKTVTRHKPKISFLAVEHYFASEPVSGFVYGQFYPAIEFVRVFVYI